MAPPNYIDRHGNVGGSKTFFRQITDLFFGIINFIALFFTAVSNPPQRISESRSTVSDFLMLVFFLSVAFCLVIPLVFGCAWCLLYFVAL